MEKILKNFGKVFVISLIVGIVGVILDNTIGGIIGALMYCLGFFVDGVIIYLLPFLAAHKKNHPKELGICMINVFFGWSVIGWIVALVLACMDSKEETIQGDKYENLIKLQKLKEEGILSEEEFNREKEKLLK